MSDQPAEGYRFGMFFIISLLIVLVAQGFGLMIGAVFDVVVSILFSECKTSGKEGAMTNLTLSRSLLNHFPVDFVQHSLMGYSHC